MKKIQKIEFKFQQKCATYRTLCQGPALPDGAESFHLPPLVGLLCSRLNGRCEWRPADFFVSPSVWPLFFFFFEIEKKKFKEKKIVALLPVLFEHHTSPSGRWPVKTKLFEVDESDYLRERFVC